jgi:hypothetical protein
MTKIGYTLRGRRSCIVGPSWTEAKQQRIVREHGIDRQGRAQHPVLLLVRIGPLWWPGVALHKQTRVRRSVAAFLASGPDSVARNEVVNARARVLCSPSLRGGPDLGEVLDG